MGLTGDAVPLVEYFTPTPTATPRGNATPAPTSSAPGYIAGDIPFNPTTVKVLAEGLQVLGTLLPAPPASPATTRAPRPARPRPSIPISRSW